VNAISARSLGKKFKLFSSQGKRLLEYVSMGKISHHTDFWALQDITFEIPAGTTLGVLGQNGSGKSTLLSILAGVLEPSAGSFEINGKVSAILELGSGFHPEFSGRDNVYMYGSIMGLSKQDIDDRFDTIVRFSELGDFIDQPLRTYSTGMTVRLAFSVAVNVNADILIVDEALAVGDAIFQHRCFRKIREMQEAGKTILYVGHDTEAVRNLCTSALLLDGGRIIERGDPNTVVNKYFALITERERTYCEGNMIEHGEIPGEEYETVYDFVQHLSDAKIENAKGITVQAQTVEIQSVPRRVIFAHPPSQIKYNLTVEPGSSLAFAIGILPEVWDKIPQGVKFDIDVVSYGVTETLFSRVLTPKRNIGDRGWHNFIITLEKYSRMNVSLVFNTSGSGEDLSYCWSAWGWGRIVILQQSAYPFPHQNVENTTLNTDIELELPELSGSKVRIGNKKAHITQVEVCDTEGHEKMTFNSGEMVKIKTHIIFNQKIEKNLTVGCVIKGRYSEIFGTNTIWEKIELGQKNPGDTITVVFSLDAKLATGMYSVTTGCSIIHSDNDVEVLDRYFDCIFFRIHTYKKMVGIVDLNPTIEVFNN
jgi:ABC-type polysaccharide/polyol phosphate transport system ATPase subunit